MSVHEIVVCSCGTIIRRCRCIGPHTKRVVQDGCLACSRRAKAKLGTGPLGQSGVEPSSTVEQSSKQEFVMASYVNPFKNIYDKLPTSVRPRTIKVNEFSAEPLQPVAEASAGCTPTIITGSIPDHDADGNLEYRPIAVVLSFDEYCKLVNNQTKARPASVESVETFNLVSEINRVARGELSGVSASYDAANAGAERKASRTACEESC